MSKLYLEILDPKRLTVFQLLSTFSKEFLLTGGTALALQIGHRQSYDFDLCSPDNIPDNFLEKVNGVLNQFTLRPIVDSSEELSLLIDEEIKITFFRFPFKPLHNSVDAKIIKLHSLEDIASNKAYVVGRRGEWKDYVDIYFLVKECGLDINKIISETKERFGGNFDQKLFWQQLVYWDDLREYKIEYIGNKVEPEQVKEFLKTLPQKYSQI